MSDFEIDVIAAGLKHMPLHRIKNLCRVTQIKPTCIFEELKHPENDFIGIYIASHIPAA